MLTPEKPRTFLAIGLVLAAILGFDIMGIMVRLLSERGYSAAEVSAYRNVLGVLPPLVLMAWLGEFRSIRETFVIVRWKLALFRGVTVAIAQLSFYTALAQLELATISALAQTNSLFVVLLSVVLLGERVGAWRIFALILGFAGALLVIRPGAEGFKLAALLPVSAAAFYAFSIVSVRYFDKSVSNGLLYLYSTAASSVAAIGLVFLTSGFSPVQNPSDVVLIFVGAMAGGTAVLFLMLAYRMAAPSMLAPFQYLGILTAFGFGWVIFGEAPIETLFPGVFLIIGAGVVILWRENRAR